MAMRENGKLRMGLAGGGEGAFIGAVHRMAAELDGGIELVCGAFSRDAERSIRSGQALYGLPAERCYADVASMLAGEAALPAAQRMDFLSIATPNASHCELALAALEAGFHVVCDKPLTHDLGDAQRLQAAVAAADLHFAVTYNYTGYPMLREARALVASGSLGAVRRVSCEYLQGWLAGPEEHAGNKQAHWRTDPEQAGAAGCFGDIGSHCHNLVEYVTGLEVEQVCADLTSFVPGRVLDDDGNVLLRLGGGARGVISASQIAVGRENDLAISVYGEHGGLSWSQRDASTLTVSWPDRSVEQRRAGGPGISVPAAAAGRLPAGHPEGYLEAFAQLYREFAGALRGGSGEEGGRRDFPGIAEGVRGMRFIEAVVASARDGSQWMAV